jgi:phosphoribosylformylglycinamidine synthase
MVEELADLVDVFGTPLISGKDSSAGSVETNEGLISVPPAVFISALGKVPDAKELVPNYRFNAGNVLVQVGPRSPSAAGTVASRVLGLDANDVDALSPPKHVEFLLELQDVANKVDAAVAIGPGGILTTLFRGVLASGRGVQIDESIASHELLQEHRCGAIVEVSPKRVAELKLTPYDCTVIGQIVEQPVIQFGKENIFTQRAFAAWRDAYCQSLK